MKARVVLSFFLSALPFFCAFFIRFFVFSRPLLPEKSLNIIGYSQACLARKNPSFHY